MRSFHVAIVGVTGAVGREMMRVLEIRNFPISTLTLLASEKSAGKVLVWKDQEVIVKKLTKDSFRGVDIALFSAGSDISQAFAHIAVSANCKVIDNSSAFRMDDAVPLVVPEINGGDVEMQCDIIANPNCTTIITLLALYPLHQVFGVKRVFASTYQAVSGTGAKAIEELSRQVEEISAGTSVTKDVYPHQIAFNVIPHVDSFLLDGYTKEEMKMQYEGRKIMHHPSFFASVTCVRVPVYQAHSVAVSAEFEKQITAEAAREILEKAPGIKVVDEPILCLYPMPLSVSGRDLCAVGRIRKECAMKNGLAFFVSGDQLLKGAALNAVQIAELLISL